MASTMAGINEYRTMISKLNELLDSEGRSSERLCWRSPRTMEEVRRYGKVPDTVLVRENDHLDIVDPDDISYMIDRIMEQQRITEDEARIGDLKQRALTVMSEEELEHLLSSQRLVAVA